MPLADGVVWAFAPWMNSGYTLLDSGPSSHHLQISNPVSPSWQGNQGFWAPRFGATGNAATTSKALLRAFGAFTVINWVHPTAAQAQYANPFDACYLNNLNTNGPRLEINSSPATLWTWRSPSFTQHILDCGANPGVNEWTLFGMTHDGGTAAKSYRNGLSVATVSGAYQGTMSNVTIGIGYSNQRFFTGLIGGTVIFGRQLSAAEMFTVWRQGPSVPWMQQRAQRRVFRTQAAAVKSYLFLNRGQVIGGGML